MLSAELNLPPDVLEAIARRAAEIVTEQTGHRASPWMTRWQAAEYLSLPLSRLEKDWQIPRHRDRGRVLYHRDELDAYFLGLGS